MSNSKSILAILFVAIAALCFIMFGPSTHEPVELSEEAKKEFLNEADDNSPPAQQHPTNVEQQEQPVDLEGISPSPLDISLIGVVASDVDTEASATIQSRLQIRTYFVDDQIAYTNAVIQEIRNDRVILLNEGQRQVLLLRGTTSSKGPQGSANKNAKNSGYDQNSDNKEIASAIGNRPKLLEHIINISPFDPNDVSAGYNVSPGMNPKLYRSARFQEGDILHKINGNDITTEEGLEAVQALLPTAQTLMFNVSRGGQVISLYLDIPSENLSIQRN